LLSAFCFLFTRESIFRELRDLNRLGTNITSLHVPPYIVVGVIPSFTDLI
jgi:hypothetical protein